MPGCPRTRWRHRSCCSSGRRVERIEHGRSRGGQHVVVGMHFAQAGQHGLETGCLGYRDATDVQVVNDLREPLQAGVGIEAEARGDDLEAHPRAHVGEASAVVVEAEHTTRRLGRIGEPDELRLRVDEAADQPGAGQAVHPGPRPRRPALALVLSRVETRDAVRCPGHGLSLRVRGIDSLAQAGQMGLGLPGGVARVVVDLAQRLERVGDATQASAGFHLTECRKTGRKRVGVGAPFPV
mmetsp:Transcript_5759/g.22391  ORF Transcript_5759/g.22391 Transcript_5759/m.22391 type:complete len:239 (+) Transcript_5759:2075-2791(+)